MTELIERRREEAIREYECMRHFKLFTDEEINQIKTKRLHHDYKVERRCKSLSDFINYITYECQVRDLLFVRRKRLQITEEADSLEKSIVKRIQGLYKRAMARFACEYRLWTHYMRYCQIRHYYIEGSRMLDQMLGYHGDKPEAWLSAVNWEHQLAKNVTRAKHYNLRGLQRHPHSLELCLALIGIQLEEANNIVVESKQPVADLVRAKNSPVTKALKMARLVYNNFERKDVQFFQQLFEELMKRRPLADDLAQEAVETMRTTHADKHEMWDYLANLALQGNEFVVTEAGAEFKTRLAKCVEIYTEAVGVLPTKAMYSRYIDTMLKISDREDGPKEAKAKRKALASAFKDALAVDQLEDEKMQQYLKLLLHNPRATEELVMPVIVKGIQQYPKSAGMWALYLRYMMQQKADSAQVETIFREAIDSMQDNTSRLTLWKMLFQYYQSSADLCEKLQDLYERAIVQEPKISHYFQPLFLEHCMSTPDGGITTARREYQRMVKNYTTPLELHQKMASLEATQEPKNASALRCCYEYATQRHGNANPSVWIEYIQFECRHGQPHLMQRLYERAKATLDEDAFALFLTEFELLKN